MQLVLAGSWPGGTYIGAWKHEIPFPLTMFRMLWQEDSSPPETLQADLAPSQNYSSLLCSATNETRATDHYLQMNQTKPENSLAG
jgi:hypothetical protein